MSGYLAFLIYVGGLVSAERNGKGLWAQAFWPYHLGLRLADWSFATPPTKGETP